MASTMAFDHVCLLLASLSKMAFEVGHMNGTCRVPYAKKYKDIVIFRAYVHLEKKKLCCTSPPVTCNFVMASLHKPRPSLTLSLNHIRKHP